MKRIVLILILAFLSLVTESTPIVLVPVKDHEVDFPSQSFWCTIDFNRVENDLTIDLFQTDDLTILIVERNSEAVLDMAVYSTTMMAGIYEYIVDAPTVAGQYRIYLVMGSAIMYGDFEVN